MFRPSVVLSSPVTDCDTALLTQSCTTALEMAAPLTDIGLSDEVIAPSYTFVSTAKAFALCGRPAGGIAALRATLRATA